MQHGSTKSTGPTVPEPTHAERARTLVSKGGHSSLSTMSQRCAGYPFGSVMPYADDGGEPLFLISTMAMHTQNLEGSGQATLLVAEPASGGEMLGAARVSLVGDARRVDEPSLPGARECYLSAHPSSAQWIDFDDFSLWRLTVCDVYFVGGFGVMGWVAAEEYLSAEPDPLLSSSSAIIEHMNEDHADALVLLARTSGHPTCEQARMTAVDRLGFHAALQTSEGPRGLRLAFPAEVRSANQCREALVQLVQAARAAPEGPSS